MKTYYVKKNEIYIVTATVDCDVYNEAGDLIVKCPANSSININPPTNKISLSDDNAALRKAFTESGGTTEACEQHIIDDDIHTTAVEKSNCRSHISNSNIHVTASDKTKIDGAAQRGENVSFSNITKNSDNSELSDNSVLNKAECDSLYAGLVGEIKYYAGSSAPEGYLVCDGSAVSRTTYAKLFAAIGTKWGAGNGSATFNLPNLIDKVAWGASTAGTYIEAGLPNITGTLSVGNDVNGYTGFSTLSGAFSVIQNMLPIPTNTTGAGANTQMSYELKLDASKSNAIYGKSSTVQPPAAKLIPIIKY